MSEFTPPLYIVLGASGGIGSEVCRKLHSHGAKIVASARREQSLKQLEEELGAISIKADASKFEEVDSLFEQVQNLGLSVSGVVNCAGSLLLKPAHQTTQQEYFQTVESNLTTAFATVRSAHRVLKENGGSIVLISSAAAQIGLPNHETIGAVKAAISGLTISAAATYVSSNIRVNAVAPGLTMTPMTNHLFENKIVARASTALHPLGRLGTPKDIASMVTWLLGPESSWVTGQVWAVDGGLSSLKARPPKEKKTSSNQQKSLTL